MGISCKKKLSSHGTLPDPCCDPAVSRNAGVRNINLYHSRRNTRSSNGVDLCARSARAMSSARYRRVRSVRCACPLYIPLVPVIYLQKAHAGSV